MGITLAYAALLWVLSVLRYHLWLAHGDDLGVFQQGLWLLAHVGWHAPSSYTGHPILTDAGAWVLIPLAAVYRFGGVWALLAVQSLCFASGYPMLLAVARALRAVPDVARLVGILYLLFPTVVGAALYDFHPDALGIPVCFGIVLALVTRRWWLYGTLLLAALALKDTVGVVLLGLALALACQRRWVPAAATAALGAIGLWLDLWVLLPRLGQAVISQWPVVYGYLGATPGEGVFHLVTHPWLFVAPLAHLRAWEYLIWMLGPVSVPLVSRRLRLLSPWWLPALAVLELNLLGHSAALTSPFDEFAVWAVPFLFVACLECLGGAQSPDLGASRRLAGYGLPMAALFFAVFAAQQVHSYWLNGPTNRGALQAAVREIPATAPVAAQDFVLPHVADRAQEWHLAALLAGTTFPSGTYVVLDEVASDAIDVPAMPEVRARLQTAGQATLVSAAEGVTVYRLDRPMTAAR